MVEVIVMLGLIATLTPILYKHVSDRRQDIDNINEAKTMLLLKETAAEYIAANKDTISVGTTLLAPADIGVDITGYQIGIRKDAEGTISAMIAATTGGNDMKAAKVASLLGVSAGIYSAQDSARAWGINGVWAENISNYGFTSLPTGVPVVTTTYDEEDETTAVLDMEEIFAEIEAHSFVRLKADEFCIQDDCISSWEAASAKNLRIIEKCNSGAEGYEEACLTAWNNAPKLNDTCQAVATVYMLAGQMPPSEVMEYRLSKGAGDYQKETCYFPSGTNKGYTENEIIYACYTEGESRTCSLMGSEIEPICNDIKTAYAALGKSAPASGNYTVYWDNAQTSYCDMSKSPAWTSIRDFTHGTTYTYNLPKPGKYRFEAYGGSTTYKGGYTWGVFHTDITAQFFIIVGTKAPAGDVHGTSGSGGTEIRYGLDWQGIAANASGTHANNYLRDKYRVMVAGGAGGGGYGGGGNNCGGGSYPGCKGVGGNGSCARCTGGGIGSTYMYGLGLNASYDGSLDKGGNGWWWYTNTSYTGGTGYAAGQFRCSYGGGSDQSAGGGGESFGAGAGNYDCRNLSCGFGYGGGGGYSGGGYSGGGYGGGGYGSGGGGRVCLESMPSGWPACSQDIFVFDEGGGVSGGNTEANGGTSDGNGIFRIWMLER
ncbi:MAG: hypothetical protein IKD08_04015 [Alphaproteobacteria bacterium]|nr:hypothetical protein [Alphaproteobacteria bacterium]